MKNFFFYCLLLFSWDANAQSDAILTKYLIDSLSVIEGRIQIKLNKGVRYMEGKLLDTKTNYPNWEGIVVKLYEYQIKNTTHKAQVYLANADATKLASWVISTCYYVTKELKYKHTKLLIDSMFMASGTQFPVQGTVFENMNGKGWKPYQFLDGVTVLVKDFKDINSVNINNLKGTGKYARIISTTREEYNTIYPSVNTKGFNWLNVVREEYQKALKSNTNNLMIAWAKSRLK
jgi:hypothetical protein